MQCCIMKIWCLSAYAKGIQDVGDFVSSVEPNKDLQSVSHIMTVNGLAALIWFVCVCFFFSLKAVSPIDCHYMTDRLQRVELKIAYILNALGVSDKHQIFIFGWTISLSLIQENIWFSRPEHYMELHFGTTHATHTTHTHHTQRETNTVKQ